MDRAELIKYIADIYDTDEEHPWAEYPMHSVFRHTGNRKWFALLMEIPKSKLGLSEEGSIDVLNVKCDPILIGSLLAEKGFYPAYHMSKAKWISIALDGSADDKEIKWLLDMSYDATKPAPKRRSH